VGFPHPTHDVPGDDEGLARLAASATIDPLGHGALLAEGLRGGEVPAGHVCATAWVLDGAGRRTLLVRHAALGWVEPGGHVELGEDPAQAAARELWEETGIQSVPVLATPAVVHAGVFPARDGRPAHHHWNLGYLFVVDESVEVRAEQGAPAGWFDVGELPSPAVADLPVVLPELAQLVQRLQP
jgi:8-oxo-dGTP pyrophosphatase MutT (NUDIX family)